MFALVAWRIGIDDVVGRWPIGGGDQVLHYGIFESATEVFPFVGNDRLGFPESQNLFFAPLFDVWSALFVGLIGLFGVDGIVALNLYNIGSFAIVGATSYLFFRALRVRVGTSVFFAVAFAVAPYHFFQIALGHPFLGNYWAVPLIGILGLMVWGPATDPFERWVAAGAGRRGRILRRAVAVAIVAVPLALSQSYYFVFGGIIVGCILLTRLVTELVAGRLHSLRTAAATVIAFFGVVGIQLALLSLNFGDRYEKYFQSRTVGESEIYGGRLTLLLTPWGGTGFPGLGSFASTYQAGSRVATTSEGPWSSILLIVALVLAVVLVFIRLSPGPADPTTRRAQVLNDPAMPALLAGTLWSLFFFIAAGLGVVFAFVVSPEIRAWSRISIVLALFSIGVLAIVVDRIFEDTRPRIAALVVASALVIVDQGVSVSSILPQNPTDDAALRAITTELADELPADCGIVQLPLKGFPETGNRGEMGDYDHVLAYVADPDNTLRWSYGAVRGTLAADYWQDAESSIAVFRERVLESGACAIWVDLAAYVDDQDAWRGQVSSVAADPAPDFVSDDGRYAVYLVD